ncbi:MAG: hypothetical protein HOV79_09625 [Hamadaea sp.]|nr:hypothetical protein [Hamadaea sp.]
MAYLPSPARRKRFFRLLILPVLAIGALFVGGRDIGPVWEAKTGGGTPGIYTAVREECSRRSCSFYGDWAAADGSSTRTDVILYDEPDSLTVGGTTEAVDSGSPNGVFATAGGITYLLVTAFFATGVIALILWIVFLVRWWRSRPPKEPRRDDKDLFQLPV